MPRRQIYKKEVEITCKGCKECKDLPPNVVHITRKTRIIYEDYENPKST